MRKEQPDNLSAFILLTGGFSAQNLHRLVPALVLYYVIILFKEIVMKKVTPVSIILLFLISLSAFADYSGGSGTAEDPYMINTAEDLNDIGNHQEDWDKHFILVADIDMSNYAGSKFRMIGEKTGDGGVPFNGVFNGDKHIIKNFSYAGEKGESGIGLFSYIGVHGKVVDLRLEDVNVSNTYWDGDVGALVGVNRGTVQNCYAKGKVSGLNSVGGLVGYNDYGTISECYAYGKVSGITFTGGFAGGNLGIISNCNSFCEVFGNDYSGGLVGANYHGTISCCYSKGSITGTRYGTGGFVGVNVDGNISNSYSAFSVSGNIIVGGLLGYNIDSSVLYCYSIGKVEGSGDVGGFVGENDSSIVSNSFWDIQTSDLDVGVGYSDGGTITNLLGKTTEEMQTQSTFTDYGWDFVGETTNGTEDIWRMPFKTGYPVLNWQILNFTDFAAFANAWLSTPADANWNPLCDLKPDNIIDTLDLQILLEHWLTGL
jgi:hypothetical protein